MPDSGDTRKAKDSPQNPHNSVSTAPEPTRNPRTKRYYPALGGTPAIMNLSANTKRLCRSAG